MARNQLVEDTVKFALERIDAFLSKETVSLPSKKVRHACDQLLESKSASVVTACFFLACYRVQDPSYKFRDVPVGARGKYGDKYLCEQLSQRSITLHNNIVAYFENVGSKGGVRTFDPITDDRFGDFLGVLNGTSDRQIQKAADYLAFRFAESQSIPAPLPPIGENVLTFARAKLLLHQLVGLRTEGFVQQFTVASLLKVMRSRQGVEVVTHHPHAADKFDRCSGDIEEFFEDMLHRSYEVTVRDDWKNRISGLKDKMDRHSLKKYVIVAEGINEDEEWYEPANLVLNLAPYGRDFAVIDILDVFNYFAAVLSASELQEAINGIYNMLLNPKLCGRQDIIDSYRGLVGNWLDDLDSEED